MKRCPYCAEEIQDAAMLCRYCGSRLEPGPTEPDPPGGAQGPAPYSTTQRSEPPHSSSARIDLESLKGHAGDGSKRCVKGVQGTVYALALTPDGSRLVSASDDCTLRVWDLTSGERLHVLKGHTEPVFAVEVTPDGSRAISGSADRTLKVRDLSTGTGLATLHGHTEIVLAVAVTPDGSRVVSGSRDGTIRQWDLVTGEELVTLAAHDNSVMDVALARMDPPPFPRRPTAQ